MLTTAKTPRPNLSRQQKHALKTLENDDSIPADKGNAMVVMMNIVSDDAIYCTLKRDPTTRVEKKGVGIHQGPAQMRAHPRQNEGPTDAKLLQPTTDVRNAKNT